MRAAMLFVLLISAPAMALSTDKAFHNFIRDSWSIEQGLPQIAVLAVAQDREGYIWAGTMSGLARFDGIQFTTYTPANTPGLPGSLIQALKLDREGRLWIATSKGLAWYRDGRFTTVPVENPAANAELDIQDVMPIASGDILLATTSGLYQVVNGKLRQERSVPGPLYTILDSNGERWIGSWRGVYRASGSAAIFEALPGLNLHDAVRHLVASGNRLWAGTSAGLFVRENGQWRRYEGQPHQQQAQQLGQLPAQQMRLATSAIGVLYEDRGGNLWAGTSNGLSRLREGEVVEQIDNDRMGPRWDYLTAFEDREGSLWFGSRTRGLTRLWSGLTTRYSTAEGLDSPLVWALDRDRKGNTWVGTDNGLSRFDGKRFTVVLPGSALPDPNVYSLLVDEDEVWIGTLRGAVLLRNGAIEPLPVLKGMDGLRISGILRDRQRSLWFATSNGLFRYADGALSRFSEPEGLHDPGVRLLFQTRSGRLLLGTQYGLAEWRDGEIRKLAGDDAPIAAIAGDGDGASAVGNDIDVTAIHELPDGRLVVGAATGQLYVSERGSWTEFNHDQGLPLNSPFFMTHDAQGYLWVAGLRGLYRVALDELHRAADGSRPQVHGEVYGNELSLRATGTQGECCNGAGNSKGFVDTNTLWLPTRNGLLVVPTETLVRNPVPPTIKIERVKTGENWTNPEQFSGSLLPARSRDLSFKFVALSFQDPTAVRLEYRLRGHEDAWKVVGDSANRQADYRDLPPGHYVFEVRGTNNAGLWSEAPAAISFGIAPFFFETIWFYALLAAGLLVLGYGLHHWQLQALLRRRATLETIVSQRTDALALANQQLEMASYTDPLTGLRNRRYLLNQVPQDLAFYRRKGLERGEQDHILLFLLIDIDHFKLINDSYGHGGGDDVLRQFSLLLSDLVRVGDYVTRWGGEEFLIVSRPLARDHAISYASRICTVVAAHPFTVCGNTQVKLSCSVGFAEYPLHATPAALDWQDLVELSDRALYHVKETGRNGWASFRFTPTTPFPALMKRFKDDRASLLAEDSLRLISSRDPLPPASTAVTVEFKLRS